MKIKFFVLTILSVFLTGAVDLSAFCIYNNTDVSIYADQINGGNFFTELEAVINPGKKECCNWKNKGCNKKHKRNSKIKIEVSLIKSNVAYKQICRKTIKAGGALVVTGKNDHYSCKVKGY